jgi:hypothetical protein
VKGEIESVRLILDRYPDNGIVISNMRKTERAGLRIETSVRNNVAADSTPRRPAKRAENKTRAESKTPRPEKTYDIVRR